MMGEPNEARSTSSITEFRTEDSEDSEGSEEEARVARLRLAIEEEKELMRRMEAGEEWEPTAGSERAGWVPGSGALVPLEEGVLGLLSPDRDRYVGMGMGMGMQPSPMSPPLYAYEALGRTSDELEERLRLLELRIDARRRRHQRIGELRRELWSLCGLGPATPPCMCSAPADPQPLLTDGGRKVEEGVGVSMGRVAAGVGSTSSEGVGVSMGPAAMSVGSASAAGVGVSMGPAAVSVGSTGAVGVGVSMGPAAVYAGSTVKRKADVEHLTLLLRSVEQQLDEAANVRRELEGASV